jgi:hypothetical protein
LSEVETLVQICLMPQICPMPPICLTADEICLGRDLVVVAGLEARVVQLDVSRRLSEDVDGGQHERGVEGASNGDTLCAANAKV